MDFDEVLHKLLFSGLSDEKFLEAWTDEIGRPEDEVCVDTYSAKLPKYGKSVVYVFRSRMVAVCNSKQKWAAYATKAWCDEREYFARWADYCRGTWVDKIPQAEGCYATRDLQGWRGKDRILRRVEGKLLDTTCCSGMVEYGRVSSWRGQWWSEALPPLPGAV